MNKPLRNMPGFKIIRTGRMIRRDDTKYTRVLCVKDGDPKVHPMLLVDTVLDDDPARPVHCLLDPKDIADALRDEWLI